MKVLVGCEFSGIVRDAFLACGHDAYSCDYLPSESNKSGRHFQCDVRELLDKHWDLFIAFPECTYLCLSGVRWLYGGKGHKKDPDRWNRMLIASRFFKLLLAAPIKRIALENPTPHRHAQLPPYSQRIQPWQFGHGEIKATCLWLKNLPMLEPTLIVKGRKPRVHHASPGPERWKERSRTLPGIADAMAERWGSS